jgi:molybdate/tungstate transport system substrate-binding protein
VSTRSLIALTAGLAAALTVTACSSGTSAGTSPSPAAPSSSVPAPSSSVPAPSSSAAEPSSSAPAPSSAATTSTTATAPTGSVSVLSAGSLQDLMQKAVIPGFHAKTGNTEVDFSAGSSILAADIKGKIKQGDVFVSASKTADETLMGTAGGNWVTWYATFASSKLVLGYNPKSSFAADLKSKPWYDVVTEPGFRLGLTPPATDPKGVLAVQALDQTATSRKLPALKTIATDTRNQFPETNLEAEVESGQLDAGFFYLAEANSADIVTVPLTGVDLEAKYTITVLNNAANPTGAASFVTYLLGPAGAAEMSKYGFVLATPITVTGTGVPASLSSVLK